MTRSRLRFAVLDLFLAWLAATVFSGAPSTAYALATGTDAALSFWPQFADHLIWGACLGLVLQMRQHRSRSKR